MNEIQQIILKKLDEIEKKENVRILHCIESGSRAWGFPSPDSDYDVRFIYVRPKEYYLKLEKTRDVIEWQLDDTLDINGWDLQKALRLLYSSNPTLFEWQKSPIVYKTSEKWNEISIVFDRYFNVKSGMYHYLSTARKTYNEHIQKDKVKLKKYFYVLRPLLCCEYIRENSAPPPMLFEDMLCYLSGNVLTEVQKLLDLKKNTSELGLGNRIPTIDKYIEQKLDEFSTIAPALENESSKHWQGLNEIFLKSIY